MSRNQRATGGILGRGTKSIGSLIGLATEAHAHHKKKAEQKKQQEASTQGPQASLSSSEEQDEQNDEVDWALDHVSAELAGESGSEEHRYAPAPSSKVKDLAANAPPPFLQPMPYPVILPQRRPQTKTRGFVRAYAPLLGECKGIDEPTFLAFLQEFYESTQTSTYLTAINVAAQVVGSVPGIITMAVSTSLTVATNVAIDAQSRYRTNTYLDQINETLFHPRNLHCLIMTFRPSQSADSVIQVDVNATSAVFAESISSSSSSTAFNLGKMKNSSGTTKAEFVIPQAAPLVYHTIDETALAVSEDGNPLSIEKQNVLKRSTEFISTYLDHRAQAEYAGSNGAESKLAIPGATQEQNFASRFSDPNHPVNSGGIIALLTGGHFDPRAKILGKAADMRAGLRGQHLTEQERANVAMGRGAPERKGAFIRQGVQSLRRLLKEDVLYLIIAEIPSQHDIDVR